MLITKDEAVVGCTAFEEIIYRSARPAGDIQEILRLSYPWSYELPKINLKLFMFLWSAMFGLHLFRLYFRK